MVQFTLGNVVRTSHSFVGNGSLKLDSIAVPIDHVHQHKFFTQWKPNAVLLVAAYMIYIVLVVLACGAFYLRLHLESHRMGKAGKRFSLLGDRPPPTRAAKSSSGQLEQTGLRRSTVGWVLLVALVSVPILGEVLSMIFVLERYSWTIVASLDLTNEIIQFDSLTEPFLTIFLLSSIFLALFTQHYRKLTSAFMWPCELEKATTVMMASPDSSEEAHYCKVKLESSGLRTFEFTCYRYVFKYDDCRFRPEGIQAVDGYIAQEMMRIGGLNQDQVQERRNWVGSNEVNVEVPGVLASIFEEFFTKTYVYQLKVIMMFCFFDYWNVGCVYLFMTGVSGCIKAMITRNSRLKVQALARQSLEVRVLRGGVEHTCKSEQLVPGDLVLLASSSIVPCDCVLVKGAAVMGEAMLTGEPMPVTKVPIEVSAVRGSVSNNNMLFMGTEVLDASGDSMALVQAIGGATQKADLVRLVLFPTIVKFKYNAGLQTTYIILVAYASIIFLLITLVPYPYNLRVSKASAVPMLVRGLFTLVQAVHPMFGVALAAGQSMAMSGLASRGISCLAPQRMPVAGCINALVLDKTGTITKDGMEVHSTILCDEWEMRMGDTINVSDFRALPSRMIYLMASCHKLSLHKGDLIGNHVDVEMFKALQDWTISSTSPKRVVTNGVESIEVLRVLDFDHARMTSGCVCKLPGGDTVVFLKGAAAIIAGKCKSVPRGFTSIADTKSAECFYVLGCASKKVPDEFDAINATRDDLEKDLIGCGLLLFKNELKPDSADALTELQKGGIDCILCTGDHLMTGIAVAKETGILPSKGQVLRILNVDEEPILVDADNKENFGSVEDNLELVKSSFLATDEQGWKALLKDARLLPDVLPQIRVFGRMKPDGKVKVVEELQDMGRYVGMCGDGGNDCGALRAAHAGLALSSAESSIVAPFASGVSKSLFQMVALLREGRACLATSLSFHSYFLCYGLTFCFAKALLVMSNGGMFAEWDFLFFDCCVAILIPSAMTVCRAANTLSAYRPSCHLFNLRAQLKNYGMTLIFIGTLLLSVAFLWADKDYVHWNASELGILPNEFALHSDNFEVEVAFLLFSMHCCTMAIVFSYGHHHRQPVWRNFRLITCCSLAVALMLYLMLGQSTGLHCLFRTNCDSKTSKKIPPVWGPIVDKMSLNSLGKCFHGPQMKHWVDNADKVDEANRIPLTAMVREAIGRPQSDTMQSAFDSHSTCLPSEESMATMKVAPHWKDSASINNILSSSLRLRLGIVILAYVVAAHVFYNFVVLHEHFDRSELESEHETTKELASYDEDADV